MEEERDYWNDPQLSDGDFPQENKTKFKVGDKAIKVKGYKFPCTIVSVFETVEGNVRVVGEMDDYGLLHIFNEDQLEKVKLGPGQYLTDVLGEELDYIDYEGYRYWYKYKGAKDRVDMCLATKDPKRYCNGFYLYSTKDPGSGFAFVVMKHNNPNLDW